MAPQTRGPWRKAQRRAWRGQPSGRHATHPVYVTYGERLRDQDWTATWNGDEAARTRYWTLPRGTQLRAI